MAKIAFCTHVSDNWFDSIGTAKLIKSAKKHHPDIPFYVFGSDYINRIFKAHDEFNWCTIHPVISYQLIEKYDSVVHFDADCIITDTLDEIFENSEYDVLCVRNNNDFNKAGKDNAICDVDGVNIQNYVNAGFTAIKSKQFLADWINLNISIGNKCNFQEQTVLNRLLATGKYKYKILDPIDSNVYYGVSALYGTSTHWDSLKDITVIDNKLILNNKIVKIIHQAGGSKPVKLQPELFNNSTIKHLQYLFDDSQSVVNTIDNQYDVK